MAIGTGITAFMGVCVVALMTGIVASAFSSQVSRRQDLLEAEIMGRDGVITEDELEKITELQNQLNLEDHHLKKQFRVSQKSAAER